MTTHPTPPDQTAAAQEREALIMARDALLNCAKLHKKEADRLARLRDVGMANHHRAWADKLLHAVTPSIDAIDAALSAQQPEPCVDVEAHKQCSNDPGPIDASYNDGWNACLGYCEANGLFRGLLTGRAEAECKICDGTGKRRVRKPDFNDQNECVRAGEITVCTTCGGAGKVLLRLQEAEAKAEGDMVTVPKLALDWLFGEAPDADGRWFSDVYEDVEPMKALDGKKPAYWWRSHFRKLISAAPPVRQGKKS